MEGNYKTIRVCTLITNIIDTVITGIAGVLVMFVWVAVCMVGGVAYSSMVDSPAIDPNGVTAGYEVLTNIFGSSLMGLVWVICLVVVVIGTFFTLALLLVIIHGYITYGKMRYKYESARPLYIKSIRRDCIFKLVLNGILGVQFLLSLTQGEGTFAVGVGFLLFATVFGLSIVNLCVLHKMKRQEEMSRHF